MKDLIIIGAGGKGREIFECVKEINRVSPTWNMLGFLSDYPDALNGYECDAKIIGEIQDWQPEGEEKYVLAINNPKDRERLAKMFLERGAEFVTLISPRATIQSHVTIGRGSIILGCAVVLDNTHIGEFAIIGGSLVGNGATIGDFCNTNGYANVTNATLGNRVMVGSHAVILNGRKVGDDALIYAGSIVFTNVKAGTKVMGNPAKRVSF